MKQGTFEVPSIKASKRAGLHRKLLLSAAATSAATIRPTDCLYVLWWVRPASAGNVHMVNLDSCDSYWR